MRDKVGLKHYGRTFYYLHGQLFNKGRENYMLIKLVKILQELAESEPQACPKIKGKNRQHILTNKEITDDKRS